MMNTAYVRLTPPDDFKKERAKAGLLCPATLSEWRRLYWKDVEANRRA